MRKGIAVLLSFCLILVLATGTAFAADSSVDFLGVLSPSTTKRSGNFYVSADQTAGLPGNVHLDLDRTGAEGVLYLPGGADTKALRLSWKDEGVTLERNGKTYKSGKAPIAEAGKSIQYRVYRGDKTTLLTIHTLRGSADISPMFLNLDESLGTIEAMNGDKAHETSCYGTVRFDGSKKPVSIKGRGNSTWSFNKKPYNITLYRDKNYDDTKKAELIPGVKAKKWSLVANYFDNSLMRNKIAMDLSKELGIGLSARFVDLYMNGEYLGNYLLTPKNDYAAPDTGYALENDNYYEPDNPDQFAIPGMFEIGTVTGDTGYYNRMTVKDIGKEAEAKGTDVASIEKHFLKAWDALEDYDSERYQDYFDLDSWAKMYLMYEVSKTYDCFSGSLLMHRDGLTKSDKLIAGPAWDYDVSFGRTLHKFFVGVSEPLQVSAEGWYNDGIGLEAVDEPVSLLQELGRHESFRAAVKNVYREYQNAFTGLETNVERQRTVLRDSALMNNAKWGTDSLCADYLIAPNTMRAIGTGKYRLEYEVTVTWDNYVNNLKEYCQKRVLWLDDNLLA